DYYCQVWHTTSDHYIF
nr:immunoglobulin light chain junction region [Macaca mulatta]MOX69635.1 immunoglobulin light chain junction region [Macaca mulatta]MOX69970.1 immunoglobulin light chain junction region [Macaca mulatta]MOX70670.1 immunoglobulin light chain junction region [Macaca mulatta]MOX71168.1 immunoglobulin light chain junction region [Macaca mulatta]